MASATLTSHPRTRDGDDASRPADEGRSPALTTTVPREYVHRTAVSEVFLTDWRHDGADSWVVNAQWPRAHSFYGPVNGLHDPVMLVETMRQAGILLSHVAHCVPLDHPIIWQQVGYHLAPEALRAAEAPAEVQLHVTDHNLVRRGKRLVSARQVFRIVCDGAELGTAMLDFSCHSPAVYRRLRGEYSDLALANARCLPLPDAVAPQLVGRERARDVVLSPTDDADRWQLRVDTSHPVLFDHPVDHTPGMLMIEAARQAAQAATDGGTLPVTMECSFERYAELDTPSWVRAHTTGRDEDGREQVEVGIEQRGVPVLAARVTSVPTP
ncbi:ScbA/BarX family gamma-butyrolactone biosynthesis protein [Streptomyces celluloflavus]|uniref:ScbA/BarX family gamma-butyrolactone biosynthesis protein n=1 Tax=Streptomyces celluloflavus TaxID=58344 RepID=UPI0036CCC779